MALSADSYPTDTGRRKSLAVLVKWAMSRLSAVRCGSGKTDDAVMNKSG
jgi:hypothetical protein